MHPKSSFLASALHNSLNTSRKQPLLCKACRKDGYTARDMSSCPCRGCNKPIAQAKYKEQPICEDCLSRLKSLRQAVVQSKNRCKCRGATNRKEVCPFNPVSRGANWWPGGENGAVTERDKRFLDRVRIQWWLNLNVPTH